VSDIKDDECGKSEYKGEDFTDEAGIFCYEGEFGGAPVWVVLYLAHIWLGSVLFYA
jgi:hypothetical protein